MVGLLIFYAKLGWVAGPGRIDIFFDDIVEPVTGVILLDSRHGRGMGDLSAMPLSHLVILPAAHPRRTFSAWPT